MAHCPTCQQHPGTMRILSAALFGKSAKWFECVHCFRGVAVPVWQRKLAWAWTAGVAVVVVGGLFGLELWKGVAPWWWMGIAVTPLTPLIWACWWSTVVRPEDARKPKPVRRNSRANRRKQDLM